MIFKNRSKKFSLGDLIILFAGAVVLFELIIGLAALHAYDPDSGISLATCLQRLGIVQQALVYIAALFFILVGWGLRRENIRLQELRDEQERFLTRLLASIPDAMGILDRELKIIRTNPVLEGWYSHRYPLAGKECREVFGEGSITCHLCRKALEQGDGATVEVALNGGLEEPIGWERVSVYPLIDNDSWQTEGVILLIQDVSEGRLAEEALAQEKERLEVTLSSLADGVMVTDTGGTITMANQAASDLTGWSPEEMRGRPLGELVNLEPESALVELAGCLESGGTLCFAEHQFIVGQGGQKRRVTVTAAPLQTAERKKIGTVWVFHDITEQHRLEQELLKKVQLESLGNLAGGIAHDFNNLLTAILGSISMAMLQVNSAHHVLERLHEAEQAGLRASGLAKKLLTFAEGGEPVKRIVSLKDLLADATRVDLKSSQVRCELSLPADLWPVEVDEAQIGQVIDEVIKNAEQAMPAGGVITVEVFNLTVEEPSPEIPQRGRYVCIDIVDQGVGIAPEHLEKVFEPYFSTKQVGRGMGLAMAYSVVRNHQGYLTLKSEPGQGTTCRICLPAANREPAPAPVIPAVYQEGRGKILLMDDEVMILKTSRLMLEKLGYEVECALDGEAALELYQQAKAAGNGFSAVILDLTIPGGMGGEETIKRLRAYDPEVRAIVSSGYADSQVMAHFREYGFAGVMPKPYRLQNLSEVLQAVMHPVG